MSNLLLLTQLASAPPSKSGRLVIYADLDGNIYIVNASGKTAIGGVASNRLVPAGGSTDQVLKKASGTDYDVIWGTVSASVAWGAITGTLSNQSDLQTALNGKAASSHTHAESDVTSLVTDLAGKAASGHDQGQTLTSGTYSPTFTNVANTSSLSGTGFRYLRVGNHVAVFGLLTATDTTGGVTSKVGISLPVGSNITATSDARGVSTVLNNGAYAGGFFADTTNDRAEAWWIAQVTAQAVEHHVSFMYIVQ